MIMLAAFRHKSLSLWQVALLVAGLAARMVALIRRRVERLNLVRSLIFTSVAFFLGCIALGVYDVYLFRRVSSEGHVIESLTAMFLLPGAIVTSWSALRLRRQGKSSPGAMLLATGFTWAFWRELEYGGNLIDGQFWYTRNFFRVESFLSPAYFEHFRQKMDLSYQASTLYAVHLALTPLAVAVVAMLVWYFIRHRHKARQECRDLTRMLPGRLFILAASLFVGAQLIGGGIHRLEESGLLDNFAQAGSSFWNCLTEESIECLGAIAVCFCAMAVWGTTRQPVGLVVTAGLRKEASRRKMAASMPIGSLLCPRPTVAQTVPIHLTARRPGDQAEQTESEQYSPVVSQAKPHKST